MTSSHGEVSLALILISCPLSLADLVTRMFAMWMTIVSSLQRLAMIGCRAEVCLFTGEPSSQAQTCSQFWEHKEWWLMLSWAKSSKMIFFFTFSKNSISADWRPHWNRGHRCSPRMHVWHTCRDMFSNSQGLLLSPQLSTKWKEMMMIFTKTLIRETTRVKTIFKTRTEKRGQIKRAKPLDVWQSPLRRAYTHHTTDRKKILIMK